MAAQDDVEGRLIDLETLVAHQEETIRDLSDMVARQWETIDNLVRDMKRLHARFSEEIESLRTGGPEKPPPHW
jgi:SlyX protein